MSKIPGGYILQPRKIDESGVMKEPPIVRELWLYLIRKVNWKNNGKFSRGSGFFRFADIQDDLCWYVGFRKMKYSKPQISKALRRLCEREMVVTEKTYHAFKKAQNNRTLDNILKESLRRTYEETMKATMKATKGLSITILNYCYYQDPKNYEGNNEETMKATRRQQEQASIIIEDLKEVEEVKEKTNTYSAEFLLFWDTFGDKKGKVPAYEKSWCKIPDLTDELVEKIIEGAKRYAVERKNILAKNGSPKMAQGWLTDRRWEDEIIENSISSQRPKAGTVYQAEIDKKNRLFQAYLQDEAIQDEEPSGGPREIIDAKNSTETVN